MITSDANLEEFVRWLESVISMMNEKGGNLCPAVVQTGK